MARWAVAAEPRSPGRSGGWPGGGEVAGPGPGDGFTPRPGALRYVREHVSYCPPGTRAGPGPLLGAEAGEKILELGRLSADQLNYFGHGCSTHKSPMVARDSWSATQQSRKASAGTRWRACSQPL